MRDIGLLIREVVGQVGQSGQESKLQATPRILGQTALPNLRVKTQQKIEFLTIPYIIIFDINIMDIEAINYTAENQILSNLCLEYYREPDEEKKKILFVEIQAAYLKKMKDK
jgi:hypothetical protein